MDVVQYIIMIDTYYTDYTHLIITWRVQRKPDLYMYAGFTCKLLVHS